MVANVRATLYTPRAMTQGGQWQYMDIGGAGSTFPSPR